MEWLEAAASPDQRKEIQQLRSRLMGLEQAVRRGVVCVCLSVCLCHVLPYKQCQTNSAAGLLDSSPRHYVYNTLARACACVWSVPICTNDQLTSLWPTLKPSCFIFHLPCLHLHRVLPLCGCVMFCLSFHVSVCFCVQPTQAKATFDMQPTASPQVYGRHPRLSGTSQSQTASLRPLQLAS